MPDLTDLKKKSMLKDEENYPIQDLQMVTSDQLNTDLDSDPVLVPTVMPNSISNDDDYFPSPKDYVHTAYQRGKGSSIKPSAKL